MVGAASGPLRAVEPALHNYLLPLKAGQLDLHFVLGKRIDDGMTGQQERFADMAITAFFLCSRSIYTGAGGSLKKSMLWTKHTKKARSFAHRKYERVRREGECACHGKTTTHNWIVLQ